MITSGSSALLRKCYTSDLVYKFIIQAITFVNHVIAFRILGISNFGKLAFLDTLMVFVNLIINMGTSEAVGRWVPQFKEEKEAEVKIYTVVTIDIVKNLIVGGVACILLYIFRDLWSSAFSIKDFTSLQALIVCSTILVRVITSPQENFLSLNYQQPFLNKRRLIISIFNILLFYLVYYMWEISVLSMLSIILTTSIVSFFLIGWKYFFSKQFTLRLSYGLRCLQSEWSGMLRYSLSMWLNQFLNHITSQRGQEYFIQILLGEKVFGLYALGKKLALLAEETLLPKSLRAYAGTNGYEILQRDGAPALKRFMDKFVGFIWLAQGVMSIAGIIIMPSALILVYHITDKFSAIYIQAVFFSLVLLRPVTIYEYYITAVKKPLWLNLAQIGLFPLTFVVYPIFINKYGLFGALMGLVLLSISGLVFYAVKLKRVVETPIRWDQYAVYFVESSIILTLFGLFPLTSLYLAVPVALLAIFLHMLLFSKFRIVDFGFFNFQSLKTLLFNR